jgi:hypothetical protein
MDRRDAELVAGRKFVTIGVRLAVLVLATVGLAVGQETPEAKPKVNDKPLTAEELAVYRVVLHGWMDAELQTINLAVQTVPLETSGPLGDEDCEKGLDLEPVSPAVVHRFRKEDLSQLGSNKIGLVDPEKQKKEVADNDPEKTTRKGVSIRDAVNNAFAHGLVTLSEIRFDKEHKLAIVSYGFYCGSLCGNGGTVVMEKRNGTWTRKSHCHDWISRQTLPAGAGKPV